ncbi:hypothetical protein Bbelb_135460 [Branchiostoma belcheri]|nr:hypothetical protein Bbelb_135460 [Branchiostoma belcheri]
MAECRQKTVVLQGLDADMFEEILSYIYSGTLHVSLDRVQHLYQAADLLQLDYVRDTCSSYMAMNVERSTCVDLYKFADVFGANVVLNSCLQCMCQHFVEVSCSEEFYSLSVDQLTEIISNDELEVKKETEVWEAVVRWVQHSREDRLQHLPSILPHIRFNLLTSDDTAAILEHPLVREDPGSSEVIRNVVQRNPNLAPRLGMMTMEMVLLSKNSDAKKMLWMNPGEGKYIRCDYNLPGFTYNGVVTHDNEIYVLAANSHNIYLCKYNHVENKWEQKSTVSEGPIEMEWLPNDYLMDIDGLFYLVTSPEMAFKKYNQQTNEWHNCAMPEDGEQLDVAFAVSCNQRIYLFTHTEMHWYDPSEDRWSRKALSDYSPTVDVEYGPVVAMGTKIFWTDAGFYNMLEYDTEADSWSEHPAPEFEDNDPDMEDRAFFVLQDTLHILVNYKCPIGDESSLLQQLFVYDRRERIWRELPELPFGRECRYDPMSIVASMYLPYLSDEHQPCQHTGCSKP